MVAVGCEAHPRVTDPGRITEGSRGLRSAPHGTRQTSLESTLKGSQKSRSVPIFRIVLNAEPDRTSDPFHHFWIAFPGGLAAPPPATICDRSAVSSPELTTERSQMVAVGRGVDRTDH